MNTRWRFSSRLTMLAAFGSMLLLAVGGAGVLSSAQADRTASTDGIYIDLPAMPDTTYTTASVTNANGEIDKFAWNSFIAMNWPAFVPTANDNLRGIPNTNASFKTASPESLAVWETFKEKREVFNIGSVDPAGKFTPVDPGPWGSGPNYGPIRSANEEKTGMGDIPTAPKVLLTGAVFDSLDETVEVLSEALEPNSGSGVLGKVVAPRVWLNNSTSTPPRTPVLYEVKVNKDFYDYVRTNGLWNDATADKQAANQAIQLPFRTNATMKGGQSQNTNATTGYSVAVAHDTYVKYNKNPRPAGLEIPGIGSVHIKAAWIRLSTKSLEALTPVERKSLKIDTFHVADAVYFKTVNGKPTPHTGTFGLIGLHIIQRVHFSQGTTFDTRGGTFVFATWEHDSIENQDYEYSNFFDPGKNGLSGKATFGPVNDVTRRPGAVLSQTQSVNKLVHGKLPPSSHWQHYNLIGTQFAAVNTSEVQFTDPPGMAEQELGQNSYLANLVIETNYGLQNFRGLPPNVGANKNPVAFNRNLPNVNWKQNGYNMGGCMGCHGVAQAQGFSFSFVLLGGNAGAKTDTETKFDLPLSNVSNKVD